MDYKQKYKQALELARDYHKANLKLNKADENLILEDIFPELAENYDERIRKRLIAMCQWYIESYALDPYNLDGYKEALAWLEKQGKGGVE